jgi:hypothetical protein
VLFRLTVQAHSVSVVDFLHVERLKSKCSIGRYFTEPGAE